MLAGICLLAGCNTEEGKAKDSLPPSIPGTLLIETRDGNAHRFTLEFAITEPQIIKGLMHRTEMAPDAGMLFWFGDEAERAFWMKNTLIPLDMIFIRKDGTIHHIHENARPRDLTSIPSQGPVAAVLEINGGISAQLGLQPGDTVRHVFFKNIP